MSLPDLATARQELEEKLMRDALRINSGNIKRAAKELGVSRVTFYRLMEKYGIQPEQRPCLVLSSRRIAPSRPPLRVRRCARPSPSRAPPGRIQPAPLPSGPATPDRPLTIL